jgi:hypothetical protein
MVLLNYSDERLINFPLDICIRIVLIINMICLINTYFEPCELNRSSLTALGAKKVGRGGTPIKRASQVQ